MPTTMMKRVATAVVAFADDTSGAVAVAEVRKAIIAFMTTTVAMLAIFGVDVTSWATEEMVGAAGTILATTYGVWQVRNTPEGEEGE